MTKKKKPGPSSSKEVGTNPKYPFNFAEKCQACGDLAFYFSVNTDHRWYCTEHWQSVHWNIKDSSALKSAPPHASGTGYEVLTLAKEEPKM